MSTPALLKKPKKTVNKICLVCGSKCDGIRCGVMACGACAVFFRRAICLNTRYICQDQEKCFENGNKKCPFCRLKKCKSLGMYLTKHTSSVQSTSSAIVSEDGEMESLKEIFNCYNEQRLKRKEIEEKFLFPNGKKKCAVIASEHDYLHYLESLKSTFSTFLTYAFSEFRNLEDKDKAIIMKSSFPLIIPAEIYFLSYKILPPAKYDVQFMISEYAILDDENCVDFWNEFVNRTSAENINFLREKTKKEKNSHHKGTTVMGEMKLMDEEYAAIQALCVWGSVIENAEISDNLIASCNKMKKHIFKELTKLYSRKLIDDYHDRLSQICTIICYINMEARLFIQDTVLLDLFNYSKEKTLVYELVK